MRAAFSFSFGVIEINDRYFDMFTRVCEFGYAAQYAYDYLFHGSSFCRARPYIGCEALLRLQGQYKCFGALGGGCKHQVFDVAVNVVSVGGLKQNHAPEL